MAESFEFTDADLVTVGAVGEPGRRVFLLQAVAGETIATLKVEKQQVAALSEALLERLQDLAVTAFEPSDLSLRAPAEIDWVVGGMGLGYLDSLDRIVIDAVEAVALNEDGEPEADGARARILLTREQAQALAILAADLVEAGRPPCPWCGHPLDPSGHTCPKTNGHHAPER
jgi:uncharacterized repeat protein (TIGR03847 family)